MTEVQTEEGEEVYDLALDPQNQIGDFGIVFEEPPEIHRTPPPGREKFPWHRALEPIRQSQGHWASFVAYPDSVKGKAQAQAKAQAVRNELYDAVPQEHWEVRARERDGEWRVYAVYYGKLTPAQQAERDRKRQERSDRVKAGQSNKAAS